MTKITTPLALLTLLALSAGTALALPPPDCVEVDGRFRIVPEEVGCSIATDPAAQTLLSDALGDLTGPCFRFDFPATLTYATGSTDRSIPVRITGNAGQIANTAPLPPELALLALDGDGQPNGLLGVWFQAVSSLQIHDLHGRRIGRFVSRDQGLQFIDPDIIDPVSQSPLPLAGMETLVAQGTLARPGRSLGPIQWRTMLPRWSGTLAANGDELGLSDPDGAILSGRLCRQGLIKRQSSWDRAR